MASPQQAEQSSQEFDSWHKTGTPTSSHRVPLHRGLANMEVGGSGTANGEIKKIVQILGFIFKFNAKYCNIECQILLDWRKKKKNR
jgi:hypothetical protein